MLGAVRERGGTRILPEKLRIDDNREYTVKIIPHQDETVRSMRLSMRLVKYGLFSLAVGAVLLIGALAFATYGVFNAVQKDVAISELQKVNQIQQEQILQLAKKTNALQEQMSRVHQIEYELQQMAGVEAPPESSVPVVPQGTHDGTGGPVIQPDVNNLGQVLDGLSQGVERSRVSLEGMRATLAEQQRIREQEKAYQEYMAAIERATPTAWPAYGDISSSYGLRWGGSDFHPGVDIANDYGTPIVATADGTVTAAGWDSGGYGNKVDIDHGNDIWTRYGHAQEVVVTVGQKVARGQVIAYMGSTGFSTGPHVHYEIHAAGKLVNPANYLH